MKKELISRVEGHGSIGLKIKGRRVESVELDILTPPRLFEKLIVGRHFNDVPTMSQGSAPYALPHTGSSR